VVGSLLLLLLLLLQAAALLLAHISQLEADGRVVLVALEDDRVAAEKHVVLVSKLPQQRAQERVHGRSRLLGGGAGTSRGRLAVSCRG
jgi:hypothetical protein